ncbi:hypothetical protein FACS189476_01950 [Spirochaetia bacterium]|nr:hypothetical protein FACS189476_01950 [Spirochaetia bacterium]
MTQNEMNNILIRFSKRAEKIDENMLVQSFVDVGPLFSVLNTFDNQVIYGRRGTGKTHALKYLMKQRAEKDIVVYIDLRNIGSSGGIYSDNNIPVTERATRLLVDTLTEIHEKIYTIAVENKFGFDLSVLGSDLDKFAEVITNVKVIGDYEVVNDIGNKATEESETGISVKIGKPEFQIGLNDNIKNITESGERKSTKQNGVLRHSVHFGALSNVLNKLINNIGGHRLFVLLDEWSSVPIDLQPYLADLLRRSIFPINKISVKIAAIEKRSQFRFILDRGDYIGIELGCDASVDINLDDYMLFDNDEQRASLFFQSLIYRHFIATALEDNQKDYPASQEKLISDLFTRSDVFSEFVRATEGIPRDAFSILSNAAQNSSGNKISMDDIRKSSRIWYQRDKEPAVSANGNASELLHWIIDEVIRHRQSRAFLLESKQQDDLIDTLFDARVLHLLKHNISSHDNPGIRYDAYKIDYGCYVDLLATSRAPRGLMELDDGGFVQVPPDDYRAIRRAILDLKEYEKNNGISKFQG